MTVIDIDEVVRSIAARQQSTGVRVVAIDGPSGAGKSTLTRLLAARLTDSTVIEIDDFNSWADPTGVRWWARFDEQVLEPAFDGRAGRYQMRDWANDEFGEGLAGWCAFASGRTVILEGVTSARSSVRSRGAYSIWVDAPADVRLARGLTRDGESHRELWLKWMEAERAFFAVDGTESGADLRVDGHPHVPHDPDTQLVLL